MHGRADASILTSKQVRMPGHVVTTDTLQRLCITQVHTRNTDRGYVSFRVAIVTARKDHQSCAARATTTKPWVSAISQRREREEETAPDKQ